MDLEKFKKGGAFLMLAFDHRGSFRKMINPQDPEGVSKVEGVAFKKAIIDSVSDQFSALLIDVEYGLKAYPNPEKPFLLPIEKSGFKDVEGERLAQLEYEAKELKDKGAAGVKLLLYFHPQYVSAASQLNVAREVMHDAMVNNLPLFLEIVVYQKSGELSLEDRVNLELRSIEQFLTAGVRPDVFKLQYPGSKVSCKKVTKLLGATPWILLTGGDDFEVFKEQLKESEAAGCQGFLAGRALWKEVFKLNGREKENFLKTTLPQRFSEISQIFAKG